MGHKLRSNGTTIDRIRPSQEIARAWYRAEISRLIALRGAPASDLEATWLAHDALKNLLGDDWAGLAREKIA